MMSLMMSHILKFVDSSEIQKSKYLENKTFFLRIKKIIHHTLRAIIWQKMFLAEVT